MPRSRRTAVIHLLGGAALIVAFFAYLVLRAAWVSSLPAAALPWLPWALHGVVFLGLMCSVSLLVSGWSQFTSRRSDVAREE